MRSLRQDDRQFSSGQVATMAGCSQAKVRCWCTEGLIECSSTDGGHFRISGSAIEEILKNGQPELPRRPVNGRESPPPRNRRASDDLHPDLYREASNELAESAEAVKIVENRVRRLFGHSSERNTGGVCSALFAVRCHAGAPYQVQDCVRPA